MQANAATHNAFVQEQIVHRTDYFEFDLRSYLENPDVLAHEGGHVDVLTGPGVGITVDEAAVRERHIDDPQWESPGRRHADGRIAQN